MQLGRFLYRFGGAILAVSSWVGILYLAKDVKELPEALQEWRELVPVDRETLLVWFSGLLVLWIVWRDVRPVALPHIWKALGWRPNADLIRALDSHLVDGVKRRNRIRSLRPIVIKSEQSAFRKWNEAVVALLGPYSLREQSYFKTLDLFKAEHSLSMHRMSERNHLEAMWNEKLKRLREIINRIEE